MTTNFSNYITTPITLITGSDEKGNEFAYAKSSFVPDGWIDLYNECNTTKRYVANYIIPNVIKVRFGNIEMTRQEWEANGCPFELSREQQIVLDVTAPKDEVKFGNVIFDIPAIAENIRTRSAELKSRIDDRMIAARERMGQRH